MERKNVMIFTSETNCYFKFYITVFIFMKIVDELAFSKYIIKCLGMTKVVAGIKSFPKV